MSLTDGDTRDDQLMPEELLESGYIATTRLGGLQTEPKTAAELANSLHFILSQYLRPSTLRRLIGPREGLVGRVMLGRSMQGEVDDDLLARVLSQAVVEHIRQSGFVVERRCI